MVNRGRKPEAIPKAWAILKKKAVRNLGDVRVDFPLDVMNSNGFNRTHASTILSTLERHGYIKKRTYGGRSLVDILLFKEELGEDVLGAPSVPREVSVPVVAATRHIPRGQKEVLPEIVAQIKSASEEPANAVASEAPQPQTTEKLSPADGVIVLVDYYNIYIRMTELKTEFPLRELILAAREIGMLKRAYMFIPPHIPEKPQMIIRQGMDEEGNLGDGSEGYRIVSCPPVKTGGKDSVDKTMDEFVSDFLGHPDVGTFVIVSGDGDFGDTRGNIANARKRWITFKVDANRKALVSNNGRFIALHNYRNANAERPEIASNIFEQILSGLEQGKLVVPERDANLFVLKKIISGLKEGRWATDKNRKAFVALYQFVWEDLRRELGRLSSKEDFSNAFTALHKHGILMKKNQQVDPKVYYIFNQQNKILLKLERLCP